VRRTRSKRRRLGRCFSCCMAPSQQYPQGKHPSPLPPPSTTRTLLTLPTSPRTPHPRQRPLVPDRRRLRAQPRRLVRPRLRVRPRKPLSARPRASRSLSTRWSSRNSATFAHRRSRKPTRASTATFASAARSGAHAACLYVVLICRAYMSCLYVVLICRAYMSW
jgi:hypothetical protein